MKKSKLYKYNSPWKVAFPFSSTKEFILYVAYTVFALVFLGFLSKLTLNKSLEYDDWIFCFFCTLMSVHLIILHGEFYIKDISLDMASKHISKLAANIGYPICIREENSIKFRKSKKEFLPLDENEITLCEHNDLVIISGRNFVLKMIWKSLFYKIDDSIKVN